MHRTRCAHNICTTFLRRPSQPTCWRKSELSYTHILGPEMTASQTAALVQPTAFRGFLVDAPVYGKLRLRNDCIMVIDHQGRIAKIADGDCEAEVLTHYEIDAASVKRLKVSRMNHHITSYPWRETTSKKRSGMCLLLNAISCAGYHEMNPGALTAATMDQVL